MEVQARPASGLPEVPDPPSAAEYARHCLTHLPYRRWCKWCVMARMRNRAHRSLPPFSRSMPLLCFDYCFVKHAGQDKWLSVLIGKLYPSGAIFCIALCYQRSR